MRITYSSFRNRMKYFLNPSTPDIAVLNLSIVGTDEQLRDLMKKISLECSK